MQLLRWLRLQLRQLLLLLLLQGHSPSLWFLQSLLLLLLFGIQLQPRLWLQT